MEVKITHEKSMPAGVVGIIYGPEGIGKTSLAASLDRPLFIDAERGARGLDVAKVDEDVTCEGILRVMHELARDHMGYRTLVLDTADYIEQKMLADFCAENKISSIEKIPYGKGYVMNAERFASVLDKARALADSGMDVVFVCHAEIRKFEMPDERGSYDRWNLKLTKQTAPKMKEAVDFMLFVNYRTNIVGADKASGETKAHATGGKRWCYTSHTTAFDAKKRVFMDLPDDCSLDDMAKRLPAAIRRATRQDARVDGPKTADAAVSATASDSEPAVHEESAPQSAPVRLLDALRNAEKAYGITDEQLFARFQKKHDERYGTAESVEEWNDAFVEWILKGMDKIAARIRA